MRNISYNNWIKVILSMVLLKYYHFIKMVLKI